MNIILITLTSILLLTVIVLFKLMSNKNVKIDSQRDEIAELDKLKETYSIEMEKNKEIYSADRRAIIAENKSYKVRIEDYKSKLADLTEEKSTYYSQMDDLESFSREMTPEEFLEIGVEVAKSDSNLHDFTGIYILENKTHDKFYVGQSISLFRRCGAHFTGKGNKDIYEDYMRGDVWTIKVIALAGSGFKSINALEKHFIEYHHSTYNGYNKTIGNIN